MEPIWEEQDRKKLAFKLAFLCDFSRVEEKWTLARFYNDLSDAIKTDFRRKRQYVLPLFMDAVLNIPFKMEHYAYTLGLLYSKHNNADAHNFTRLVVSTVTRDLSDALFEPSKRHHAKLLLRFLGCLVTVRVISPSWMLELLQVIVDSAVAYSKEKMAEDPSGRSWQPWTDHMALLVLAVLPWCGFSLSSSAAALTSSLIDSLGVYIHHHRAYTTEASLRPTLVRRGRKDLLAACDSGSASHVSSLYWAVVDLAKNRKWDICTLARPSSGMSPTSLGKPLLEGELPRIRRTTTSGASGDANKEEEGKGEAEMEEAVAAEMMMHDQAVEKHEEKADEAKDGEGHHAVVGGGEEGTCPGDVKINLIPISKVLRVPAAPPSRLLEAVSQGVSAEAARTALAAVLSEEYPPRGGLRLMAVPEIESVLSAAEVFVVEELVFDTIMGFQEDRVECTIALTQSLTLYFEQVLPYRIRFNQPGTSSFSSSSVSSSSSSSSSSSASHPSVTGGGALGRAPYQTHVNQSVLLCRHFFVQVLFNQIFLLPHTVLHSLTFETLMVELVKIQDFTFGRVMSSFVRELFAALPVLDVEIRDRFCSFLAYFLSCHSLQWPWAKWEWATEKLDPQNPHRRFCEDLLTHLIRLLDWKRVYVAVPKGFQRLMGPEPIPFILPRGRAASAAAGSVSGEGAALPDEPRQDPDTLHYAGETVEEGRGVSVNPSAAGEPTSRDVDRVADITALKVKDIDPVVKAAVKIEEWISTTIRQVPERKKKERLLRCGPEDIFLSNELLEEVLNRQGLVQVLPEGIQDVLAAVMLAILSIGRRSPSHMFGMLNRFAPALRTLIAEVDKEAESTPIAAEEAATRALGAKAAQMKVLDITALFLQARQPQMMMVALEKMLQMHIIHGPSAICWVFRAITEGVEGGEREGGEREGAKKHSFMRRFLDDEEEILDDAMDLEGKEVKEAKDEDEMEKEDAMKKKQARREERRRREREEKAGKRTQLLWELLFLAIERGNSLTINIPLEIRNAEADLREVENDSKKWQDFLNDAPQTRSVVEEQQRGKEDRLHSDASCNASTSSSGSRHPPILFKDSTPTVSKEPEQLQSKTPNVTERLEDYEIKIEYKKEAIQFLVSRLPLVAQLADDGLVMALLGFIHLLGLSEAAEPTVAAALLKPFETGTTALREAGVNRGLASGQRSRRVVRALRSGRKGEGGRGMLDNGMRMNNDELVIIDSNKNVNEDNKKGNAGIFTINEMAQNESDRLRKGEEEKGLEEGESAARKKRNARAMDVDVDDDDDSSEKIKREDEGNGAEDFMEEEEEEDDDDGMTDALLKIINMSSLMVQYYARFVAFLRKYRLRNAVILDRLKSQVFAFPIPPTAQKALETVLLLSGERGGGRVEGGEERGSEN